MDIVGRHSEKAAVIGLTSGALVVTGEPGAGKSTLLELAATTGERRVLRGTGAESERQLPFAGLHQLLRPVLREVDILPVRQRSALLSAVGHGDGEQPDRLLINVAVLTLLSELARRHPLLVVADDAQWLDDGTRDVLVFVARRIDDEPLAVLVGTRDELAFPGLPTLAVGPLDEGAANAVLDSQPRPPVGRHRANILAHAAGNPLALTELARADIAEAEVLPLTERLERVFAADLHCLPAATRHALLLVAADATKLTVATHAEDLAPAERAGLVRIVGSAVRFRHPLVRSAVYHSFPLGERRAAHRELAELLRDEPDRRAWHLAAAATGTDETVAAELEATSSRARQRGGYSAATAALEKAAELSPAPSERARRLVLAAGVAVFTGQPEWVEQLASRIDANTEEPAYVASAALRLGQVMIVTSRQDRAFSLLMDAAEDPDNARQALASAAVAAFYTGDEHARLTVRARAHDDPWTRAVTDPFEDRSALVALLPALLDRAAGQPGVLTSLGAMAWLLDETGYAVRIFDDALYRWRATGHLPTGLGCSAGWAYFDYGRFAEARLTAGAATSASPGADHLSAAATVLEASVLAVQGDAELARTNVERALSVIDPSATRAVGVRAMWALGMAAVAAGDHATAYEHFRSQFTADGAPVHYHSSYVGLAELAASAVRIGRGTDAADIVERTAERLSGNMSARMHMLIHRARALLDQADAEPHFQEALSDPATEQWPFERAQVLLDYAEWLRRRRRITAARPKLAAALDVFRRLGAQPWIERTRGELRAAGVEIEPARPNRLAELTAQQQQIVRLAAHGLTNREIGERLFLSPRTIGSHLYRSFPKLGVTARSQLRDVVGDCSE